MADLGHQGEGPERGFLAIVPGRLVQDLPQAFQALRIEGRMGGVRNGRAALEGLQAPGVVVMDRVAYSLRVTAQVTGDLRHPRAAGAGQQDLGPAEDKGFGRTQTCLQGLTLAIRELTDKDRLLHTVSLP
jgi:hypothetical protein